MTRRPIERQAVIDETGQYRYALSRTWGDGDMVTWIMLNPSTADASIDDPTIRRCMGFAAAWGFAGIQVINLYAYRATKPDALKVVTDPIGPDHMRHFVDAVTSGKLIVAAWGACKHASPQHVLPVLVQQEVKCLGKNSDGSPKHPLYVRGDVALEVWP